ncbi:hypothetical protein [Aestuariispira insulae]|uniref:Lipoprotein n=1 Tax=Aestuariispira insulae TaxID=1461337 RepID=A0A3D9HWG6_9PROT|nr:hypothetical protein [Aestuariispira insulae]RED53750.1 hypothetical protein DFP90_101548 [Aestuariispira insulae]
MKMMKQMVAAAALALLAGCNGYALVKPEQEVKIADAFSFKTTQEWNRLKQGDSDFWTLDGIGLQLMSVKAGIKDGEKIADHEKAAVYKNGMTTLELLEMIKTDLVATDQHNIEILDSRPIKSGGYDGFIAEYRFENKDGLEYKSLVRGIVHDDKLSLMRYSGLTDYYYNRGRSDVEQMMVSMQPL